MLSRFTSFLEALGFREEASHRAISRKSFRCATDYGAWSAEITPSESQSQYRLEVRNPRAQTIYIVDFTDSEIVDEPTIRGLDGRMMHNLLMHAMS